MSVFLPLITVIFTSIKWSWSSLIESQLPVFIVFYLHVLNNHLSRTSQIKLGIVLWVQRCSTYCKLSNSVGTNIMHKHYTSQSAYDYDLEVQLIDNSIQLFCISVLFYAMSPFCWFCLLVLKKRQWIFLASFWITFKLSYQLWHKIALFTAFDFCSVQTV